jgi:putative transposase
MQAAKVSRGLALQDPCPKGMPLPRSRNRDQAQRRLARTHLRVAHIRQDFLPKTSTRLCRENQAVGIETLAVAGMLANHHVARAVADQGFGRCFSLITYQAQRDGTGLVEADRWFPSSHLCATPGGGDIKQDLTLHDRPGTCPSCGLTHDRDGKAAIHRKGMATRTALPVAPRPIMAAAMPEPSDIGGKVTPVRDEATPPETSGASGQEEAGAHHCAPTL